MTDVRCTRPQPVPARRGDRLPGSPGAGRCRKTPAMWTNAFDTQPDIDLPGLPRRNVRPAGRRRRTRTRRRRTARVVRTGQDWGAFMRASTCTALGWAALALG